jgi:probable phosphoglycerate mutase
VSPPPARTRLLLVRHGESRCNIEGIVGGERGCTGLTARGAEQVAQLAQRLAASGELAEIDALYASTLPRAIETAEILRGPLEAIRGRSFELVIEDDLRELDPGQADAMSWPVVYERWGPFDFDLVAESWCPGAESWRQFAARVAGVLVTVAERHVGETVLIACHGGVIGASLAKFLPLAPGVERLDLDTRYASVTEWWRDGDRFFLGRYNEGGEASQPVIPIA